jgi:tol-pal system protein YbgF
MKLTTLRATVFLLTGVALAAPSHLAWAQMSAADLVVRIDQLERTLRQITGTVEELQYRNQQLDQQVKRLTDELDARQQSGTIRSQQGQMRPGSIPPPAAAAPPPVTAAPVQPPAPTQGGRRSDAFDPTTNPSAPGAPRPLGGGSGPRSEATEPPYQTGSARVPGSALPPAGSIVTTEEPAAPGGREPGAPLDLSTLASAASSDPQLAPRVVRDPSVGAQVATLPPSPLPRDEYDLAYGYVLRKDYALAEEGLRQFLRKFPSDRLAPDAQFWLGETLYQRHQYREAADIFVGMSKKYENHQKAPDALLRLGQSLGALNERELACATFGEVPRKFPRASLSVKQAAEREQKRYKC